ncbi:kinesin-like protein kif19, putative [Ichthyophthirius multifiliis]|uniref:Kinesin-like protein n=1 Tax=Ichthyophthirius multifiliis TaxID=5932 RepID=G0R0L7_ICHMU|nr:kinesin-like protein kif19, putative [Ichthyophthirius multifiliis]EGR29003.1 kinesin-like protein kif19, putative [Ichthyophthirius multifiliis]|eukprot:XP_004030239.1 kinesin-like protein kif19, putative [Ichthyophthirius multifiliis]
MDLQIIKNENQQENNIQVIQKKLLPEIESNILVAIRVRPLNQKEENQGDQDIIRIEDNLIIVFDPIEMEFLNENKKMLEVYHRSKEQTYAFDKVFNKHSQEEVYQQTCKSLIKPVAQGYNATVFAYGPTGTGKTHTMLGNQEIPGLCTLTIQDMFQFIRKDIENEYHISITYVEIYNETIRDLLIPHSSYLELRDDPIKGITIAGVSECHEFVISRQQKKNYRIYKCKFNIIQKSCSILNYSCFQIQNQNIEQENMTGKLSLIDLAGSERGTVTENRGIRLREGAKINQSLLALANCINALGDKSKKGFFVPYRDSKLTRMLKDSLGGNCKTVMIANISPSSCQFEETINTLKYANRAKNIKTKVLANKKLVTIHIAQYKNIINDLKQEIDQLKAKLHERIMDGDILNCQDDDFQFFERQNNQQQNNNQQQQQQQLNNQQKDLQCNCGRYEDELNMKQIQEEIFENFQDRIQLRRVKAVKTLKLSTEQNKLKKELMNLSLMDNINTAKKIRDNIPKKIKFEDKRNFIELIIKNHVLELQNIELEINLQIQEKTIQDFKQIIESQKKIIFDNNIRLAEETNVLSNNSQDDDTQQVALEENLSDEEYECIPDQQEENDEDDYLNDLVNIFIFQIFIYLNYFYYQKDLINGKTRRQVGY